jgi:hypothetical protein
VDDISIADNCVSVASAVASDSVLVSPIIDLTQNEQDKVPPQPANPETPQKRQRVGQSKLWAGMAISVLIVLELCAGSAGLSCAIRDAGFDACPIDHKFNKHKPKMPIANFDLSSPFGQNYVLELLNSGRVFAVHIGPPCGTASRAREKPLPRWIKDRGVKEPRPLRSETEPRGLRSLQGLDKLKVEAANSLYDFTAVVINRCLDRSVFFLS